MHRNVKLQLQEIKDGNVVKQHSLDINVGMNASRCQVNTELLALLKAAGYINKEPDNGEE